MNALWHFMIDHSSCQPERRSEANLDAAAHVADRHRRGLSLFGRRGAASMAAALRVRTEEGPEAAAAEAEAKDGEAAGFLASAIGRLGMGELNAEPRRLQASIEAIDAEMKSLSVKHYGVHIQSAKGVAAVANGCKRTAGNAARIQESLGQLSTSLEQFRSIGQRVADAHARNRQTLDKHVQLLELLQIPQLMDTCSRNNLFDEALDLASFANTLQWRHRALATTHAGPEADADPAAQGFASGDVSASARQSKREAAFSGGTAIIDMIAGDVNASAQHMRKQMLQQLRQQINLPTCLRIISLLKRLDAQERVRRNAAQNQVSEGPAATVTGATAANASGSSSNGDSAHTARPGASAQADEIHLRFEFLDCRDAYIRSLATEDMAAYTSRPYQSSLKLIERCRVNWFDVITQYKAIFATGDNILQELEEDGGILARWVSGKMTDFLLILESAISNIEDFGSLANVLEQAMKFGLSLARVGADFRPLLMEPFKRRIFDLMINYWQQALERAVPLLESGDWGKPLPLPRANAATSNGVAGDARKQKLSSGEGDERDQSNGPGSELEENADGAEVELSLSPPHDLLEFPVAAEAMNIFLTSFNELRQCATPIVAVDLGRTLAEQLTKLADAAQKFHDENTARLAEDAELQERFNRLCEVMGRTFMAHIQRCFDAVFDRAKLTRSIRTFVSISETRDAFLALKLAPSAPQQPTKFSGLAPPRPESQQLGQDLSTEEQVQTEPTNAAAATDRNGIADHVETHELDHEAEEGEGKEEKEDASEDADLEEDDDDEEAEDDSESHGEDNDHEAEEDDDEDDDEDEDEDGDDEDDEGDEV